MFANGFYPQFELSKPDICFRVASGNSVTLPHFQFIGELGLKSKYLSSDYKKPLCIDIEDVKFSRLTDRGLEIEESSHATNEPERNRRNDDAARYVTALRNSFIKVLDYILQFLPPTAMIIAQVRNVMNCSILWCGEDVFVVMEKSFVV